MIYISLTTVPMRLNHWESFSQNLQSLVDQKTDKEYQIILTIPETYRHDENQKYMIHEQLLEFNRNHPKLIINRETPDYGPIIKVYGALKYATDPDDIIIACDDDHYYHEEMLEYHVKKLNEHPHNAICFRGDMAVDKRIWTVNGVTKYVYRPDDILFPVNRDCFMMIPGHWHSVGYWRRFFEDDFNEELFSLADGDDPIIGYYMKLHEHVPLCVVWDKETDLRPIIDECGYKPTETFPIVRPLGYPESGGTLIRNKFKASGYAFGGNHGREEEKISKFLCDIRPEYVEKDINVFLPRINNIK
jgi:glycosyltransferase involved in cell wall biosynthesis